MDMTLRDFFSLWELFGTATLTGTFAGLALGVLGVHVVLRRMVFLTAAISQSASLGVVLAVFAGASVGFIGHWLSPTMGALLMTLATLVAVGMARRSSRDFSDAMLGALYLLGAAGTLVVGSRIQMELHDLNAMLFGTAVAVVKEDFHTVAFLSVVIVAVQLWLWRGFAAVTVDAHDAKVRGFPVRLLDVGLLLCLAVFISVSTRVLGPLPTFAFSILPSTAAVRLAPNMWSALVLGGIFGAATGFGGYVVATLYDLPVGPAQALLGLAIVVVADLLARVLAYTRKKPTVAVGASTTPSV